MKKVKPPPRLKAIRDWINLSMYYDLKVCECCIPWRDIEQRYYTLIEIEELMDSGDKEAMREYVKNYSKRPIRY